MEQTCLEMAALISKRPLNLPRRSFNPIYGLRFWHRQDEQEKSEASYFRRFLRSSLHNSLTLGRSATVKYGILFALIGTSVRTLLR